MGEKSGLVGSTLRQWIARDLLGRLGEGVGTQWVMDGREHRKVCQGQGPDVTQAIEQRCCGAVTVAAIVWPHPFGCRGPDLIIPPCSPLNCIGSAWEPCPIEFWESFCSVQPQGIMPLTPMCTVPWDKASDFMDYTWWPMSLSLFPGAVVTDHGCNKLLQQLHRPLWITGWKQELWLLLMVWMLITCTIYFHKWKEKFEQWGSPSQIQLPGRIYWVLRYNEDQHGQKTHVCKITGS